MRTILSAFLLSLLTCVHAQEPAPPTPESDTPVRFAAFDVLIDSGPAPLAAYQLNISAQSGRVRIVGIEGGDHGAFREPPFYDPKAIQNDRVILAAFSVAPAEQLPTGRQRVATLHLQISGAEAPRFKLDLQAAATTGGHKIAPAVEFKPRKSP